MDEDFPPKIPRILTFPSAGDPARGLLISTQQAAALPFPVKRVFWVQQVPEGVRRGGHAGKTMAEVLVALQGRVEIRTESPGGRQHFVLDQPSQGLYVPERCWIELSFSADALLLCLASTDYDAGDYISDYAEFKRSCLPGA
ncbi:MAG: sugar 3,4-ketoisomerase [Adhaeribacter sp.]